MEEKRGRSRLGGETERARRQTKNTAGINNWTRKPVILLKDEKEKRKLAGKEVSEDIYPSYVVIVSCPRQLPKAKIEGHVGASEWDWIVNNELRDKGEAGVPLGLEIMTKRHSFLQSMNG